MEYTKQNFKSGMVLTDQHLNNIEDGLVTLFNKCGNRVKYDKENNLVLLYMDNTLIGTIKYESLQTQRCNVLFIGNSYSENTAAFMYDLFAALGVEDFHIAVMYVGGCSIDTHLQNAQNNKGAYAFHEFTSGTTVKTTKSYTIQSAITLREWDWIIFSQKSDYSGDASTYANLPTLIEYFKQYITNPNTKYAFNMTWAWQTGFSNYNNYYGNPSTMYNQIVSCMESQILTNNDISCLIPNGTALQNARLYMDEAKLFRDKTHLSANGCFVASLTATFALLCKNPYYKDINEYDINMCLSENDHFLNSGPVNAAMDISYANEYYAAACNAINNPLSITTM
jgi:hypothetical protein